MAMITLNTSRAGQNPFPGNFDKLSSHRAGSDRKMTFEQACQECNAITLEEFIDKLRREIHEDYAILEKLKNAKGGCL